MNWYILFFNHLLKLVDDWLRTFIDRLSFVAFKFAFIHEVMAFFWVMVEELFSLHPIFQIISGQRQAFVNTFVAIFSFVPSSSLWYHCIMIICIIWLRISYYHPCKYKSVICKISLIKHHESLWHKDASKIIML